MVRRSGLLTVLLILCVLVLVIPKQGQAIERDMDPLLPALVSFVIPGGGQLLNDQSDKALTHFAVWIGLQSLHGLVLYSRFYTPVYFAVPMAWSAYSAYDAYQVADRSQRRFGFSDLRNPGARRGVKGFSEAGITDFDSWLNNEALREGSYLVPSESASGSTLTS